MRPMLAEQIDPIVATRDLLTDNNWICQQKIDGHRICGLHENGSWRMLNRNGEPYTRSTVAITNTIPQLPDCFSAALDGELVDGVWWLFDMPTVEGSLEHRLDMLAAFHQHMWPEGNPQIRLLPVSRTADEKIQLMERCLRERCEGVMYKHRESLYHPGVRSREWLKVKFIKEADVVVLRTHVDGKDNCEFGVFTDDGAMIEVGRCSLIGKPHVEPGDVITVRYLYLGADNRLYQPRLMKVRDDKPVDQCLFNQLIGVNKRVLA